MNQGDGIELSGRQLLIYCLVIDVFAPLDLERLGAARYVAGLQSTVELEAETPAAVAAAR